MMSCGRGEVIIVADRTKFGRLTLARLCGLDEVNLVISDSGLPEEDRCLLERAGVGVRLAAPSREADGRNGAAEGNLGMGKTA